MCLIEKQFEGQPEGSSQLSALNYVIEKAVLKQELGSLETFGQVSTYGFFYNARASKANKGSWLGNIDIA